MKLDDFRKLKSIMERTFSDNDPEALASIRAANRILQKDGLTWTRVLDRSVSVDVPFEPAATAKGRPEDEIDDWFEVALNHVKPGSFRDMLEDIYEKWQKNHFLTPRQKEVVREAAERARDLR